MHATYAQIAKYATANTHHLTLINTNSIGTYLAPKPNPSPRHTISCNVGSSARVSSRIVSNLSIYARYVRCICGACYSYVFELVFEQVKCDCLETCSFGLGGKCMFVCVFVCESLCEVVFFYPWGGIDWMGSF